jgi:exodeoxyribonuclease VII large subunit
MNASTESNPFSIAQLNQLVGQTLKHQLGSVWITGEISNLARPSSGHLYFTLKDPHAQVRCALFRAKQTSLHQHLKAGHHVLARAQISLYEPRGDYQLIIDKLEETGDGALQRALAELKQKLAPLFDPTTKQRIPNIPRCLGVVTSATGAAIHDILTVLKRRCPTLPVIIYPTLVQGPQSAQHIAHAITTANERNEVDVLLVARGGGSLEDLWGFNEAVVAYAINASSIPVITGIGHETDTTIADLCADLRCATPSAAAERASPTAEDILTLFDRHLKQCLHSCKISLAHHHQQLAQILRRIHHPQQRIWSQLQTLDHTQQRIHHQMNRILNQLKNRLLQSEPSHGQILQHLIKSRRNHQQTALQQCTNHIRKNLTEKHNLLRMHAQKIHHTSPMTALTRGYAIITDEQNKTIKEHCQIQNGQVIHARIGDADLSCTINTINPCSAAAAKPMLANLVDDQPA